MQGLGVNYIEYSVVPIQVKHSSAIESKGCQLIRTNLKLIYRVKFTEIIWSSREREGH